VDEIDARVLEQILEFRVTLLDAEGVAHRVQLLGRALADGVHAGVRMPLINRINSAPKPSPTMATLIFLEGMNWGKRNRAFGGEAGRITARCFGSVNGEIRVDGPWRATGMRLVGTGDRGLRFGEVGIGGI